MGYVPSHHPLPIASWEAHSTSTPTPSMGSSLHPRAKEGSAWYLAALDTGEVGPQWAEPPSSTSSTCYSPPVFSSPLISSRLCSGFPSSALGSLLSNGGGRSGRKRNVWTELAADFTGTNLQGLHKDLAGRGYRLLMIRPLVGDTWVAKTDPSMLSWNTDECR